MTIPIIRLEKNCPRSRIEVRPTAFPRQHALESASAAPHTSPRYRTLKVTWPIESSKPSKTITLVWAEICLQNYGKREVIWEEAASPECCMGIRKVFGENYTNEWVDQMPSGSMKPFLHSPPIVQSYLLGGASEHSHATNQRWASRLGPLSPLIHYGLSMYLPATRKT